MTSQSELGKTDAITVADGQPDESGVAWRRVAVITAIALSTILVVGALAVIIATQSWVGSDAIAPNVFIGGLDVSGMTEQEALSALRNRWVPSLPDAVTVSFPGGQWQARREELGVRLRLADAARQAVQVGRGEGLLGAISTRMRLARSPMDITVAVDIDEDTLDAAVGGLAEVVDREPVDADIKVVGDRVEVVPGVEGRLLDIDATMDAVSSALADPRVDRVEAVVRTQQPSVTAEDLAHIEVVLGQYSTPFNPARADRTHNLRLAVGRLNELVIHPGEQFAFNETVGERLVDQGWREAPIFINGEVKPSTGGGICQIATTTYNAALLANMEMLERHHHSRPVDYAPTGRDATVYWGQYDLRFRNTLDHPVLVLAEVADAKVTIRMLGAREDDADVEIIREGLTRIPCETKEVEDPELDAGETEVEEEGRDGWRVTVYRRATRDGEVIRDQKLHTDYYRPQTEVIRVGTKAPDTPTDELEGAGGVIMPGDAADGATGDASPPGDGAPDVPAPPSDEPVAD